MDSKRSHYRVRARHASMRVSLRTGQGAAEGVVEDLSIQGARVRFRASELPQAMPGDRVRLEFRTLLLIEPLCTEAVLRSIHVEGELAHLGCEFADPRAVLRDVPYVLQPYFNRRRHPRVDLYEAIEAELTAPGVAARGWLRQVGTGGAMVGLPMDFAARLARNDRLELRFALPHENPDFWFLTAVRGLWNTGSELGCSLRFDRRATVDARRQVERLRTFVEGRLVELDELDAGRSARLDEGDEHAA